MHHPTIVTFTLEIIRYRIFKSQQVAYLFVLYLLQKETRLNTQDIQLRHSSYETDVIFTYSNYYHEMRLWLPNHCNIFITSGAAEIPAHNLC
jgi:hypothetical protein